MTKKYILTIAHLLLSIYLFGQYSYSGQILDKKTKKPIAFANIKYFKHQGLISDIDGRYTFESKQKVDSLTISFVGYEKKNIAPTPDKPQTIWLTEIAFELSEVVVTAKDDPALRIVRNLSKNMKKHRVAQLDKYLYKAYDKFYFTSDKPHDSLIKENPITSADSANIRLKKVLERQHLFLIENITEVSYLKPQKKQEKVLSSRMSGFKSPLFNLLLSQMQPTDFYGNKIHIGSKSFANPFTGESLNKYWFVMQDTIINTQTHDSSFIISYYPKKEVNFIGVEGVATISSKGWAFENITAKEKKEEGIYIANNIVIEQNYQYVDNQYWFPSQLNTKMTLSFLSVEETPGQKVVIKGIGKRYLFDVSINGNEEIDINPAIAFKYDPNAYKNQEKMLLKYRQVPFTAQDMKTYEIIDSIGKADNLELHTKNIKELLMGRIPWGKISFPISDILNYNNYEGFRLGLKAYTNNRLSRYVRFGGYVAYGFKDKGLKYGGNASLFFDYYQNHFIHYDYHKDVLEPGTFFNEQFSLLSADNFRNFNLSRFDKVETHTLSVQTKPLYTLTLTPAVSYQSIHPTYGYEFEVDNKTYTHFNFLEAGLNIRFAFGEKFIQTPNEEVSLGTKYPVLHLELKKGFKNEYGDFDYLSAVVKVNYTLNTNYFGATTLNAVVGKIKGDVPIQKLFHGRGNRNKWFNFYSRRSFSTMEFGRFYHREFAALFFEHNFKDLLIKNQKFAPHISVVQNILFGQNNTLNQHRKLAIEAAEKGYFESGFLFNRLLKISFMEMGVGLFYRYGHYAEKRFSKDFSALFAYRIKL